MGRRAEHEIQIRKAKEEYIYGIEEGGERRFPTIEELAKKHGISLNTLYKRSSREGWTALREEALREFERKRLEERAKRQAKNIENIADEYYDNIRSLSRALVGATGKVLKELTQSGELNPKDLRSLVQSVKDLALVGTLIFDKAGISKEDILTMEGLSNAREVQAKVFKAVRQALKEQAVKRKEDGFIN